ncbi:type II toxin-antitoxin system HicB family antitoxin [Scytonema sp. PRP1]|uniref:type II toxin-antitoxin system HicB family antitoxin n=1 Tax=Scytonema sp. PRP1 TaxID=3120513 RepID=UPI002FD01D12
MMSSNDYTFGVRQQIIWKTLSLQYLKKSMTGILATSKSYRRANVQERTLEEARESLREAIELIIISNRELAEQQLSGKDFVREKITVKIS